MEKWQRGFELEKLKEVVEVFRRHHTRHCYGAFGLVKERDIADALKQNRIKVSFADRGSSAPNGAIIWNDLSRPSKHTDFTGRKVSVYGRLVTALAADEVSIGELLLKMAFRKLMAVEIFEEDLIAKAVLEQCGFQYKASKVLAGSEIKGLYTSPKGSAVFCEGLPPEEQNGMCCLGKVNPELLADVQTELVRWGDYGWAQHYSNYNLRKSWTSFALRGYDETDPEFIIKPAEMSQGWKKENPFRASAVINWTPAVQHFPKALELLESLGFTHLDRVRFMKLASGGELSRHADVTDRDAGLSPTKVARLHIPIVTNFSVRFHSWDARGRERLECYNPGDLFYLDHRKPHRVTNSGADRIHLVVDVYSDSRLRSMIAAESKQYEDNSKPFMRGS